LPQPIAREIAVTIRIRRVVPLLAAAALCSACGAPGVKPWERDLMAKPEMQLDASPIDSTIDDHLYFSKEASTGGRGFGGGGCGCN
jgi:hypothetical protein